MTHTNTFTRTYTAVSEETAKRAKENISYSDYKEGTATARQKYYVDAIVDYAEDLMSKNPTEDLEKLEQIQSYIDRYSRKIAEAIDKDNAITCRCPSVLITGAGNFPTRRKEKQNAAANSHWQKTKDLYETNSNNYYFDKIRKLLTDSGEIRSDDPNAVEKIKAKIAKLENAPSDRWGYNKTEIRRLKERLLVLAPDEVKQGVEVTINGVVATYENILALYDGVQAKPSQYDPERKEFYLPMIKLVFSNGKRKFTEYLSEQVTEDMTGIYSYRKGDFIPFTDKAKFNLVLSKIHGTGNKAVIYSILKDLDPEVIEQKAKFEELKASGQSTDRTGTINGEDVTIKANTDIMRLQLFFDGKPDADTRTLMKSNGFKWSLKNDNAWQRLLNENAESALNRILDK